MPKVHLLQGGSFWSGFASGAFSSLGGSLLQGFNLTDRLGTVGSVGVGALMGGIAAELSGGDFGVGAISGAWVTLFNHLAHKLTIEDMLRKIDNELSKGDVMNKDEIAKYNKYVAKVIKSIECIDKHKFVVTLTGLGKFLSGGLMSLPNDNIFTITQVERFVMVTSTTATFNNGQPLNVFIKGNSYKINNGNYGEGWHSIDIDNFINKK